MDRSEALKSLQSRNSDDRLRAARTLGRNGEPMDVQAIETALLNESNRWAKRAMQKAVHLLRSEPEPAVVQIGAEGEDERSIEQIHADAVQEATQRLVHEIRPILGRLDVNAAREMPDYASSKTKAEWSRLHELLTAIDKLGQAAAAPVYVEFNLVELLDRVISSETDESPVKAEMAGPRPFVIVGAGDFIHLVITNAVKNAIEAAESISSLEPIVLNWGATERDNWIAVLDRGRGLPSGFTKVFEIGTTTKKGHLGMGLAIARQAALTLAGRISLSPRDPNGARFEFRWPICHEDPHC